MIFQSKIVTKQESYKKVLWTFQDEKLLTDAKEVNGIDL